MPSNEMAFSAELTDTLFEVLTKVVLDEVTPEQGAEIMDAKAISTGFYTE